MPEVGVLAIGADAAALRYRQLGVPVLTVCSEPVRPLDSDLEALIDDAARAALDGVDAERWRFVDPRELPEQTRMLWAISQVRSEAPTLSMAGWQRALVVAWANEVSLVPVLRAVPPGVVLTVLLGGRASSGDPDARRNLTVLAEMCRRGDVAAIVHNAEPDRVLEVALDTALRPTMMEYPRLPPVDVGAALGVNTLELSPEPEIPLFGLVHVPLGVALQVPTLMRDLAARAALHGILHGPPVDVEGVPVLDLDALRETLPSQAVFEECRAQVLAALDQVVFEGDEPLVENIARALRPLQARLQELAQTCSVIDSHRILRMRAFGAAGIHFTAQRLRSQLDDLGNHDESDDAVARLSTLLGGEAAAAGPLAWRRLFAGVPSFVVRRGTPGRAVAVQMVTDRFSRFRGEFAAALAEALEQAVRRALDPRSPLPTGALRALHLRAERVRDALDGVITDLDGRILAGAEIALRQDGLLRWVTPDAEAFRRLLQGIVEKHVVSLELERTATLLLTRRPLGMVDPDDFDAYLDEVVEASSTLTRSASVVPDYESVLLTLLSTREPAALRAHLTDAAGIDPTLFIRKNTSSGLIDWFSRTGMRVEVRVADPCAIYWRSASDLADSTGEGSRLGTQEHHLEDLLLPPPEGEDVRRLAAMAQAGALVLAGLAVGELGVRRVDKTDLLVLRDTGINRLLYLPHGALHGLVCDPTAREALLRRVSRRIDRLAAAPDAAECLQKLIELATLGPCTRVRTQIGLNTPWMIRVQPAIDDLLARYANLAVVSVLEHMRADEVRALIEPPTRHAVRDLLQLAPLGA